MPEKGRVLLPKGREDQEMVLLREPWARVHAEEERKLSTEDEGVAELSSRLRLHRYVPPALWIVWRTDVPRGSDAR